MEISSLKNVVFSKSTNLSVVSVASPSVIVVNLSSPALRGSESIMLTGAAVTGLKSILSDTLMATLFIIKLSTGPLAAFSVTFV